jgi:radical SAM superfamily enzyme YgiQ (UPF0313 family)
MKVLFATAPFHTKYTKQLPGTLAPELDDNPLLGLYLLSIILREYGCEVDVVFGAELVLEPQETVARALNADLVCLSATSFNWSHIKTFIEQLDQAGDRPPIIVGGVHPTLVPEYVMHSTPVDIAVVGEGEKTICELVDHFRGKRSLDEIQGIYYRRDGQVLSTPERALLSSEELGQLPIIRWDEWAVKPTYLSLQTSRGCLMNCAFCSVPFHHSWRPFPLDHILSSLEACVKSTRGNGSRHIRHIAFADDCFTPDPQFARDVLTATTEIFPHVRPHIEGRVRDLLKPGVLEHMASTNVQMIQVGVECGYDAGLRKVTKGLRIEEVEELGHRAKALGMGEALYYSYIVGFPWETSVEMKKTIDFAFAIANRYGGFAQICWWMIMPGSRLYQQMRDTQGLDASIFDKEKWWFHREVFLKTHPTLSMDEIHSIYDYSLSMASSNKDAKKGGSAFRDPWVGYVP